MSSTRRFTGSDHFRYLPLMTLDSTANLASWDVLTLDHVGWICLREQPRADGTKKGATTGSAGPVRCCSKWQA